MRPCAEEVPVTAARTAKAEIEFRAWAGSLSPNWHHPHKLNGRR